MRQSGPIRVAEHLSDGSAVRYRLLHVGPQSSVEDVRRAVSEASAKSQQEQDAQSGSQGQQQGTGNQQARQANDSNGADGQSQTAGQGKPGDQSADAAQPGSGQAGPNSVDNGHHEDVGSDNSVYAPSRVNANGQNLVLPENQGVNAPNPNARTNPGVSNQSTVPYQQVYSQYAKTADDALRNGEVPSDLRDYVHDYFSSLDPNARK